MADEKDKINPYESPKDLSFEAKSSVVQFVLRGMWPAIRLATIGVILGGLFGVGAFYFDLETSLYSSNSFIGSIAVGVVAGLVVGSLGGVLVVAINLIRRPR